MFTFEQHLAEIVDDKAEAERYKGHNNLKLHVVTVLGMK